MRSTVVSRGHNISYKTEGTGTPLILLAGFSQWTDEWWDTGYIDRLRDNYRVIAVDRLGHGESDKPHEPTEYLEHLIVSDIVAVLDAEKLDQAIVWGFSMGARNATSLAVMEPTRVTALIVGGGSPLLSADGRRERVLDWAEAVKTDEGFAAFARSFGASDEEIGDTLAHNDAAALSAVLAGTADWFPAAEDVVAPTLWYKGSDDSGGFSAEEVDLAERLGVETHLLSDSNHVAAFVRADDALSFIRPFLDKHRN
jgi:pimeloyl-ACP methyl ester carboxylesterase